MDSSPPHTRNPRRRKHSQLLQAGVELHVHVSEGLQARPVLDVSANTKDKVSSQSLDLDPPTTATALCCSLIL